MEISFAIHFVDDLTPGIAVLGAPVDSGKTVLIVEVMRKVKLNNPEVKIKLFQQGSSLLANRGLHEKFFIPKLEELSNLFPRGTVIIIDQIDIKPDLFDDAMQSYIVELATDSRNSGLYSVILSVSNSEVYAKILDLHSGAKIRAMLDDPSVMKWNKGQMKEYIFQSLIDWSTNDKNKLLELYFKAQSPAVLRNAVTRIKRKGYKSFSDIDQENLSAISKDVRSKASL
jgi:hypothetical protein